MKTLFFLLCFCTFSSVSAQSNISEKTFSRYYKQVLDSINNMEDLKYANGTVTKIESKKRKPGVTLFKELAATNLADITANATKVTVYTYHDAIKKIAKHSITAIVYNSTDEARLIYEKIIQTALEKSGVPGLTYTNDIVLIDNKTIYWFNSNCIYSLQQHTDFVDAFIPISGINKSEYIECGCGEVKCRSMQLVKSH